MHLILYSETKTKRFSCVPWINDEYIQLARDRDCFRKKFNQTKENQYNWKKYKFY